MSMEGNHLMCIGKPFLRYFITMTQPQGIFHVYGQWTQAHDPILLKIFPELSTARAYIEWLLLHKHQIMSPVGEVVVEDYLVSQDEHTSSLDEDNGPWLGMPNGDGAPLP